MKSKQSNAIAIFSLSSLVAAQAVYHFVSGESYPSSLTRNILVVVQFLFGIGYALWGLRKWRRIRMDGEDT